MIKLLPEVFDGERNECIHGCDRALTHAILTHPTRRDPSVLERLDAVAGRVTK